jgi:hypothetical protein
LIYWIKFSAIQTASGDAAQHVAWAAEGGHIDVNVPATHSTGYQVPAGKPFLGGTPVEARPEIWWFGLRNPWRYSFGDPARGGTGGLLIGDVGQG